MKKNYKIFRLCFYLFATVFIIYKLSFHEHGLLNLENFSNSEHTSLKLTSYDNKKFELSQFLNQDKYILLNFWASWCSSCLEELPDLSKLAKKYNNKIIFIGAALDSPAADVKNLVLKHKLNYIIAKVSSSEANKWHAEVLPTTYLLNPKGEIIWGKSGSLSFEELELEFKNILNK